MSLSGGLRWLVRAVRKDLSTSEPAPEWLHPLIHTPVFLICSVWIPLSATFAFDADLPGWARLLAVAVGLVGVGALVAIIRWYRGG